MLMLCLKFSFSQFSEWLSGTPDAHFNFWKSLSGMPDNLSGMVSCFRVCPIVPTHFARDFRACPTTSAEWFHAFGRAQLFQSILHETFGHAHQLSEAVKLLIFIGKQT